MDDTLRFEDPRGPIEAFRWAHYVIAGQAHGVEDGDVRGAGKDVRVIGTAVTPWRERHGHTLTAAMLEGLAGQGIEVLVIGQGVFRRLRCPRKVLDAARGLGITEVICEATPAACSRYNALYHAGRRVALLAHGTC